MQHLDMMKFPLLTDIVNAKTLYCLKTHLHKVGWNGQRHWLYLIEFIGHRSQSPEEYSKATSANGPDPELPLIEYDSSFNKQGNTDGVC